MHYRLAALLLLFTAPAIRAAIPATPVMTVYKFNGPFTVPTYSADGSGTQTGTLTQGTSVIPCLVIRDGKPLTDGKGTPWAGFEVVVDPRRATPADTQRFKGALAERAAMQVQNHHCAPEVENVIDVRQLYALKKPPFFDPPGGTADGAGEGATGLDRIIRTFHASPQCAAVNATLTNRRGALADAWDAFIGAHGRLGTPTDLAHAKHLDYVMRTALHEGHLKRGCNAYGTCERNVIALSIRNRAIGQCRRGKGCSFPGDFQGASSAVSQYNIWDEYLTQISGLTSCFLRPDLAVDADYAKLQSMYAQSVGDIERILFGTDVDLAEVFPGTPLADLTQLRHYYHAPAMGKCFPRNERVEYISGAVASNGTDFALLADTRIEVGAAADGGYSFKQFLFEERPEGDAIQILDRYPGFIIDGRKIALRDPAACAPYGIPAGCAFEQIGEQIGKQIGRYRRTPSWINQGRPVEISCRVKDRGENCQGAGTPTKAKVGGTCDLEMRPMAGVR